jgi:glucose-1-phosphate adenylyltransferase
MSEALGIINFERHNVHIAGMDDYRPVPAMSFLGRYRTVDFMLSNMTNSGIENIKLLIKDKPRSLIEHLRLGTQYNINSKRGQMQILYSDVLEDSGIYYHDVNAFMQNMQTFEESTEKYVVIAPSYMIYIVDFRTVLQQHIASGADVTLLYHQPNSLNEFLGCCNVTINENGRVTDIDEIRSKSAKANVMLECYVMSRQLFIKLVREASALSSLFDLKDYLKVMTPSLNIMGYKYEGYVGCMNTFNAYYRINMEMINHEKAKELFHSDWPIYTRTNDSAPAFYSKEAHVKNCLIANGCEIHGDLENCIVGRAVSIGRGCVLRNALILPKTTIGEFIHIENAVVDKHVTLENKKEVIGTANRIAYIRRDDHC